jgi:hypothetical protein
MGYVHSLGDHKGDNAGMGAWENFHLLLFFKYLRMFICYLPFSQAYISQPAINHTFIYIP